MALCVPFERNVGRNRELWRKIAFNFVKFSSAQRTVIILCSPNSSNSINSIRCTARRKNRGGRETLGDGESERQSSNDLIETMFSSSCVASRRSGSVLVSHSSGQRGGQTKKAGAISCQFIDISSINQLALSPLRLETMACQQESSSSFGIRSTSATHRSIRETKRKDGRGRAEDFTNERQQSQDKQQRHSNDKRKTKIYLQKVHEANDVNIYHHYRCSLAPAPVRYSYLK